jgi:hypothetical protein
MPIVGAARNLVRTAVVGAVAAASSFLAAQGLELSPESWAAVADFAYHGVIGVAVAVAFRFRNRGSDEE